MFSRLKNKTSKQELERKIIELNAEESQTAKTSPTSLLATALLNQYKVNIALSNEKLETPVTDTLTEDDKDEVILLVSDLDATVFVNEEKGSRQKKDEHIKDEHIKKSSSITAPVLAPDAIPPSRPITTTASPALDARHPYRLGWPLLPTLPVHTSREQVPKWLSKHSLHLTAMRQLLARTKLETHNDIEVVQRHHRGKPITRYTLTLLVQSEVPANAETPPAWSAAVHALRRYIQHHNLRLSVEIIDHRVYGGMYTLPVLATDPLSALIAKRKCGIARVLDGCGAEWTSLEFWYRGHGATRGECRATVLIGVPGPERRVWWEEGGVVERVRDRMQGKMEVEVEWRVVEKY